MGYNIVTLQAIKDHWEKKTYNIYSILLAKDFTGIDDNDFTEMLALIHNITGEKACCYYFTPKSWNVKEFFAYYQLNIVGKVTEMKEAIVKGTKKFEKSLLENLKMKKSEYFIPALTETGRIWTFGDLGIFFFFRNKPDDPSDCLYVPLSKAKWKEQLELILNNPENYDQLINRLQEKKKKIYKILTGKEGDFKFKLFNTGISIFGVVLTILSLL